MTVESEKVRENVDKLRLDGREIYLVGTAHVSRSSTELVDEVIRNIKPDSVVVELCESRYKSLKDPEAWKKTDIVSVIKEGRSYVLFAQLLLASYQKRIGTELNIKPGAEMMKAIEVAEEQGMATVLGDREIKTTLKRMWSYLGFWSFIKLLGSAIFSIFDSSKLKEEEIEKLKSSDALDALLSEFSSTLPDVRNALIDERDIYLSHKIKEAPGQKIVAVVGAGHVPGIKKRISEDIDISYLDEIPPPSLSKKIATWFFPLIIVGLLIGGFIYSGTSTSVQMIESWIWVTGAFASIGAIIGLAHPLTVLTAFISAPFATIHPLIATGWFAGLAEAIIRKPRVADFETITDDIGSLRGIYKNRVSRVLLVIITTNIFAALGTIWGVKVLVSLISHGGQQ